MTRWTEDDIARLNPEVRDRIARSWQGAPISKTGAKFKARETWVDNIRFPSKLQAAHYVLLKQARERNEIAYFLREVNLDLPGGVRHRVDWLYVYLNATQNGPLMSSPMLADSKGFDTPMGRLKRKQVLDLYGIKIRIWSDPERIDL